MLILVPELIARRYQLPISNDPGVRLVVQGEILNVFLELLISHFYFLIRHLIGVGALEGAQVTFDLLRLIHDIGWLLGINGCLLLITLLLWAVVWTWAVYLIG